MRNTKEVLIFILLMLLPVLAAEATTCPNTAPGFECFNNTFVCGSVDTYQCVTQDFINQSESGECPDDLQTKTFNCGACTATCVCPAGYVDCSGQCKPSSSPSCPSPSIYNPCTGTCNVPTSYIIASPIIAQADFINIGGNVKAASSTMAGSGYFGGEAMFGSYWNGSAMTSPITLSNGKNLFYGQINSNSIGGNLMLLEKGTGAAAIPFFVINSIGRVGIGTNNPLASLHVNSELTTPLIVSGRRSDNNVYLQLENKSALDAGFRPWGIYQNQTGQFGIHLLGGDISPFRINQNGLITMASTTYFSQNVGIGTSNPMQSLSVYKISGDNAEIAIQSLAAAGSHWGVYQDRNTKDLRFWQGDNRVVFTDSGNVGIGVLDTLYKLEVAGESKIGSNLTVDGQIKTKWIHASSSNPNDLSIINHNLLVGGSLYLRNGTIVDSSSYGGVNGYILQSTGGGVKWVATSTLGLGSGGTITEIDPKWMASSSEVAFKSKNNIFTGDYNMFQGELKSWWLHVNSNNISDLSTINHNLNITSNLKVGDDAQYANPAWTPGSIKVEQGFGSYTTISNISGSSNGFYNINRLTINSITSPTWGNQHSEIYLRNADSGKYGSILSSGNLQFTVNNGDTFRFGKGISYISAGVIGLTNPYMIIKAGNVGIGTEDPNKSLHIKTASGNAEIDIQSANKNHWGIYHDANSEALTFWNADVPNGIGNLGSGNSVSLKNNGDVAINNKLCLGGVCKDSWDITSSTDVAYLAKNNVFTGSINTFKNKIRIGDKPLIDASYSSMPGIVVASGDKERVIIQGTENAGLTLIDSSATSGNKASMLINDNGLTKLIALNDNGLTKLDNIFVIDNSTGKVGIGTASPNVDFNVIGNSEFNNSNNENAIKVVSTKRGIDVKVQAGTLTGKPEDDMSQWNRAGYFEIGNSYSAKVWLAATPSNVNQSYGIVAQGVSSGVLGIGQVNGIIGKATFGVTGESKRCDNIGDAGDGCDAGVGVLAIANGYGTPLKAKVENPPKNTAAYYFYTIEASGPNGIRSTAWTDAYWGDGWSGYFTGGKGFYADKIGIGIDNPKEVLDVNGAISINNNSAQLYSWNEGESLTAGLRFNENWNVAKGYDTVTKQGPSGLISLDKDGLHLMATSNRTAGSKFSPGGQFLLSNNNEASLKGSSLTKFYTKFNIINNIGVSNNLSFISGALVTPSVRGTVIQTGNPATPNGKDGILVVGHASSDVNATEFAVDQNIEKFQVNAENSLFSGNVNISAGHGLKIGDTASIQADDSCIGKAGTVIYSEAGNVGNFYGCVRTDVNTYVWKQLNN